MSEGIELYKKDGTETGVFYCSECRTVFASKEQADICHGERICACGATIKSRYQSQCDECWRKDSQEKEATKERERFEKATKIPYAEYKGEMVMDGDDYFNDLEEVLDRYLDGQEPEYVWACEDVGCPKANIDNIVENMLENMWEDADINDLNGVAELEAAVEAFNKANESIRVYIPDYTTAILIPNEAKNDH
jgi:hypothetical protein